MEIDIECCKGKSKDINLVGMYIKKKHNAHRKNTKIINQTEVIRKNFN